jgi:hypothetical protein
VNGIGKLVVEWFDEIEITAGTIDDQRIGITDVIFTTKRSVI